MRARPLLIRIALCVVAALFLCITPGLRALENAAHTGDFHTLQRYHPTDRALIERWIAALTAQGDRDGAVLLALRLQTSRPHSITDDPLTSRDWSRAILDAQQRIAQNPQDAAARYTAAALLAADDPQQAAALFSQAARDLAWRDRADAAYQVIQQHARDPVARLRAIAIQLLNDDLPTLAEYNFNRLAGIDGAAPATLAFLGLAQGAQGRDGWPLIALALANAPADPQVNYAAALHWRRVGQPDRALAALGQALQTDARNPAIAAEIGAIYREQAIPAEAARWLLLSVTLAPDDVTFQRALGAFHADDQYLLDTDGLTAIRRALTAFPDDGELNALYGQALFIIGQQAQAQSALDRALTLQPTNARARFYTARLREQLGQPDAARALYQGLADSADSGPFRELARRALEMM